VNTTSKRLLNELQDLFVEEGGIFMSLEFPLFTKHRGKVPAELESIEELLKFLSISDKELNYLSLHSRRLYRSRLLPKRSGGFRLLEAPNDRLKHIHRMLLSTFEKIYVPRNSVHGFTKGRSVMSNAAVHQKRPFLLNIDLKNYFETITFKRVRGLLQSLGVSLEVANVISRLTVTNNRLPQGAPTSPILANMVSFSLDVELHNFAKKNNMRYTRYADDISLSSFTQPICLFKERELKTRKLTVEDLSEELVSIISGNGFTLNEDKLWFSDKTLRREVTGLIVNEFPNIPRKYIRNIRTILYKIDKLGYATTQAEFATKFSNKKKCLKQVLRGKIEWVAQVKGRSDPVFRKLADRYNSLLPNEHIETEPTYAEIIDRSIWVVEWCHDIDGEVVASQGTAFFLQDIGLVSAHHVFEGLPEGESADIYLPSDHQEKFQVCMGQKFCQHVDVAILEHDIPDDKRLELPKSSGGFSKRDEITVYGFPNYNTGDVVSEVDGKITAVSTISAVERISVSSILNKGISGGPILDNRSHVIGVVHKGGTEETRQLATSLIEIEKISAS
jgi:retron-type reverse transcriptase